MECGSELEYFERGQELTCISCGKQETGYIACPQGHYVCDDCHNRDAVEAIKLATLTTALVDPLEIAESMMALPSLPMLGCQHAYIAAGALLAAIRNSGTRKITDDQVADVFARVERQAIGGYCGLTGVCGITPAVGAVFAILLGSKCGTDIEQLITMEATTRVSLAITGLTGPSCCKAYVRASIVAATELLRERLGIPLLIRPQSLGCEYVDRHPHGCRTTACPYYEPDKKAGSGRSDEISSGAIRTHSNSLDAHTADC